MNYLDELKSLLDNKGMTALKTLFFGGWRGGSAVKEGKGKRGGKGGGEEEGREECNRQTAQGQQMGLTTKKKRNSSLVHQWALKKKMKSMLAEGISPVNPKYHRREGWKLQGASFSDMLTVLTEEKQEGREEYKDYSKERVGEQNQKQTAYFNAYSKLHQGKL